MQVSDDAYVSRDLAKFNHADETIVYMPGGHEYDMAQHVQDMMTTFASFPDVRPHNHPYKIRFGEGNWTFALTDVTGTNTGPIQGPNGWTGPTGRGFNIEMATLGYWEDGKILIKYIWADGMKQTRQLGFLPSPLPNEPTVGLSLSNHSVPLSKTGADNAQKNKGLYHDYEAAFNKGSITAKSLKFSKDIKVYGVDLDGKILTLDQYLDVIKQNKRAFPDLKLASNQVLGSGDWTVAVSTLTGTLTGAFEVPDYLSEAPIQANGNKISVRQFTIARWQDGVITHLKFLNDPLTILAQVQ
ncbi:hypothetical protein G7Z17_g3749 [Cylindrodendrum hubeiense]|uniref:SnoaL-like polyketide cyclase n=1 Tax=Cylindrodendrum hubeiense TaxID=595255 RepID=A0A9P5HA79_9HYPO|nr:hypothetical protein G7Z17_g3749 [Cylindrodendrum hubeiense]